MVTTSDCSPVFHISLLRVTPTTCDKNLKSNLLFLVSNVLLPHCSSLFTLFIEPRVGKAEQESWKKVQGPIETTDMFILSLTGVATITADTLDSLHGWSSGHSYNVAATAFQVELICVYRAKVAGGQAVHLDLHVQCCKWSQLLHNHVFTKHGAIVRDRGGERAWPPPFWLICSYTLIHV